jgi:transcriptional regulator with XRE-family HTH domain
MHDETGQGDRLKAARLARGLSQRAAARTAGVHQPDWSDAENGRALSLDRWHFLARAIGVDPWTVDRRLTPRASGPTIVFNRTPHGFEPASDEDLTRFAAAIGERHVTTEVLRELVDRGCVVVLRPQ